MNLEHFVTLLYDRTSSVTSVDKARLELLTRKQKPYDAIPPSRAALLQHAKRAAYQAGIIWAQATINKINSYSYSNQEAEHPLPCQQGLNSRGGQLENSLDKSSADCCKLHAVDNVQL